MLRSLDIFRQFGGTCCLHFNLQVESGRFVRNVGEILLSHLASHQKTSLIFSVCLFVCLGLKTSHFPGNLREC